MKDRKNNIIKLDDKGRMYVRTGTGVIMRPIVLKTHKHFGETIKERKEFNKWHQTNAPFQQSETDMKVGEIVIAKAGEHDTLGTVQRGNYTEHWWVNWNLETIDLGELPIDHKANNALLAALGLTEADLL